MKYEKLIIAFIAIGLTATSVKSQTLSMNFDNVKDYKKLTFNGLGADEKDGKNTTLVNFIKTVSGNEFYTDLKNPDEFEIDIVNGKLQFIRKTGAGEALFCRTTIVGPFGPNIEKIMMDINFKDIESDKPYIVRLQNGGGFGGGLGVTANGNEFSEFSLVARNDGKNYFQIGDVKGNIINDTKFYGVQKIVWVTNKSGEALSYQSPDGKTVEVGNLKIDLWVGKTLVIDEGDKTEKSTSPNNNQFKMVINSGKGIFEMDNLIIYNGKKIDGFIKNN